MTKKYYMKPALEISQAEVEEMMAISVTVTQTNGLDEGDNLDYDDKGADPWDSAW